MSLASRRYLVLGLATLVLTTASLGTASAAFVVISALKNQVASPSAALRTSVVVSIGALLSGYCPAQYAAEQ